MKTNSKVLVSVLAGLLVLAVTGCSTVSTSSHQYLGTGTVVPSNANSIAILQQSPSRPFTKLGEVYAEPSTQNLEASRIEESLRLEAAKLGADAVVIQSDCLQTTGAVSNGPRWNREYDRTTGRVITGVAIRYNQS